MAFRSASAAARGSGAARIACETAMPSAPALILAAARSGVSMPPKGDDRQVDGVFHFADQGERVGFGMPPAASAAYLAFESLRPTCTKSAPPRSALRRARERLSA